MKGFEEVFIREETETPGLNTEFQDDFSPSIQDIFKAKIKKNYEEKFFIQDPLDLGVFSPVMPVSIPQMEQIYSPDLNEPQLPYDELEISEEQQIEPQDIKDTLLTYDKKLRMKCTVELHKGDFYGTSCCSRCRKIKGIQGPMFQCKLKTCVNLTFPSKFAIREHNFKKHSFINRNSTCFICNSRCLDSRKLRVHLGKVHFGYREFKCNICQKQFSEKKVIIKHIEGHGVLENIDNWENHVTRGNLQYTLELGTYLNFDCNVCDEKCYTESILKSHLKIHNVCSVCGEDFATKDLRYEHFRTHKRNATQKFKKKNQGSWKYIKDYWAKNKNKKKNKN